MKKYISFHKNIKKQNLCF